jgi:hypothetical protein
MRTELQEQFETDISKDIDERIDCYRKAIEPFQFGTAWIIANQGFRVTRLAWPIRSLKCERESPSDRGRFVLYDLDGSVIDSDWFPSREDFYANDWRITGIK